MSAPNPGGGDNVVDALPMRTTLKETAATGSTVDTVGSGGPGVQCRSDLAIFIVFFFFF
jgi:hypothetical protein